MPKSPLNDIADILQNPSIQMMLDNQKMINTLTAQMPPALLEYTNMINKAQQNLSDGLLASIPMIEWAMEKQVLIQSLENIVTQLWSTLPREFQILKDTSWVHSFTDILPDYRLAHIYPEDSSDEESEEIKEVNNIIIGEIFNTQPEEVTSHKEPAIIALSPINDDILKYLAEHPEAMYHLSGSEFEDVMAELYNKLGYDVHKTKRTRDGGKDIIIRKPDLLGDFILYVECKKYAANRPIGVSIVRNLESTISMDRVNGGILATTSFFTKDARELIMSKDLQYQIRMQDYNDIRNLLNKVV